MIKKLRRRVIIYTMLAVALVLFLLMGIVNAANYVSKDRSAAEMLSYLAENGGMFPGEGDQGMGGPGMQGMGGQDGFRPDGSGTAAQGTGRNEAAVPDADDDEAEEADSDEPDDDSETGGIDDDIGDESEDNLDDRFDDGLDDRFDGRKDFRHHGLLMTEETPFETRFFTVTMDAQGAVTAVNTGRIAAVTETQAAEMVEKAETKGKSAGYDGNYKYLKQEKDGGAIYVFLDCTRDLESVKSFLRISLLVSLIGLAAIALLVIALSPRMIRPIAESHAKQKEFITNAGHELKTPMAVIASCTDVIEMETGETKWTRGIRDQVKKLSSLTSRMVSLARMDEGPGELPMEEVDLSALMEESLQGFSLAAEQQGRALEMTIEPDIHIMGNKEGLRDLISILADNALKYGEEGGEIKVTLRQDHRRALLQVYNSGQGIRPEELERIFDRFYRADKARSRASGSYGLGLAIARSIVTRHGGSIHCESDSRSTRFVAILPVKKAAAQASAAAAAHILSGREKEGGDEGTSG